MSDPVLVNANQSTNFVINIFLPNTGHIISPFNTFNLYLVSLLFQTVQIKTYQANSDFSKPGGLETNRDRDRDCPSCRD